MRKLIPCCLVLAFASTIVGEELTLENVTATAPNDGSEPIADSFSMDSAVRFLDQASLDWTKNRKCFTCHTNFSYLLARPMVSADAKPHGQIRAALESLVQERWSSKGPRWDAEVVMAAATLAVNDGATSKKLSEATRTALDRMWTLQRDDGGFDWLKCGWPPMESDDDYGIAIALIATHAAPGDYASSKKAQEGVAKLHAYLKNNRPPTIHHEAMLAWADSYGAEALSAAQRESLIKRLLELQLPDGGWSAATLGDWKRADGKGQDIKISDGYGTGFVVFVLRRAGVAADHPQIQKGLQWLKSNQRKSGRWYARSLNKDSKHFLSHAGSAFAVMALASCEE